MMKSKMFNEEWNRPMIGNDRDPKAREGHGSGLALLILLLTWGPAGCGPGAQVEGAQENAGYTRVINVEVSTAERSDFTEFIRLTGTVQANQDVVVSAEESGVVREIVVDKGNRVSPDQPIIRLDAELLQAQVDQARALAGMARETWERRKRLYEEDQVGSELVYLEARYGWEQAAANLKLLEERLERTVIRAPIAGILDTREIEVGTMVSAGTPVARIVDTDPVKITAGVPERYATDVATGTLVEVTFDVLGDDEVFGGRISYVGATVNPRNRTFPIEFSLPNPGGVIKPEMVAGVSVVRKTMEGVVVVPQEAVVRVEDGYVAFVAVEENGETVAGRRSLELGPAQRNQVVVQSGLEVGDRLIVVGQQSVAEGDRVNVVAER